ncbi:hypothetical protein EAO70_06015 [Streptomyces sp. adm13(2018)]|uniref:hypothetical protein n=1 Tax=Streptomyces sp. adm13(2018) TaxID=2479007 RepID=UPI0011CE882B|nr:hypothetical protein [Streptomyces sp. adm13(2018)]TXS22414.1 hypothetical protein EAO70_06015 [Streptomyces sp. adm13(2018)]
MNLGLLIGLTRARVFLLFAGFAWVFGLQAPLLTRLALVGLAAAAVTFDGLLDEQRIAHSAKTTTIPPQRTRT